MVCPVRGSFQTLSTSVSSAAGVRLAVTVAVTLPTAPVTDPTEPVTGPCTLATPWPKVPAAVWSSRASSQTPSAICVTVGVDAAAEVSHGR